MSYFNHLHNVDVQGIKPALPDSRDFIHIGVNDAVDQDSLWELQSTYKSICSISNKSSTVR